MEKYVIFETKGGIGKAIMATAVCKAISIAYPDRKIVVLSSWVEPFINNPYIYRVYNINNTQYFYDDFVKGQDTIFLCNEPYSSHGFLSQKQHLIKSWCDSVRIQYNGELPELFLSELEIQNIKNQFASDKPIMLIQPFGGLNKKNPYAWNRDLPYTQAQNIVNLFKDKYRIVQIGLNKTQMLRNVVMPELDIRSVMALTKVSQCRVLIDSFVQHTAAAFNMPSVVCWITNKPEVFGYAMHSNILARTDNLKQEVGNYFGNTMEYDFSGAKLHDFPFNSMEVFDLGKVFEAIKTTGVGF